MTDLMAADAQLRRRLDAFAVARLSPDPTATARIRARVLATAHRQAALARADASLVVVPADATRLIASARTRRPVPTAWRRAATALLAASLVLSVAVGSAFAAAPGGPLYGTRLWIETLTLPSDPSARAIAELERMDSRLREAAAANVAGDQTALAAALTAYEAIVDDASDQALRDGDEVASAALKAGVTRNITVLTALATRLPDGGTAAVTTALERAIDRSDEAVHAIGGGNGGNGGNGGGTPGAKPTPTSGPAATSEPTPTPKATKVPKPTQEPTAKPTKAPTAEPAAEPTRTPRPDRTPRAGGGQPSGPPGQGGSGNGN